MVHSPIVQADEPSRNPSTEPSRDHSPERGNIGEASTIYDFTVKDAKHQPYDLSKHRGQVVLIMNVASQCGFTKSGYTMATELYNKYKDQGFTVLAFPCNQFGFQEPGTEEQIVEFACTKFKAEFPIMEKVHVNGANTAPLWRFLKDSVPGWLGLTIVKWNFSTFLVDRRGVPCRRFSSVDFASTIEAAVVELLAGPASP